MKYLFILFFLFNVSYANNLSAYYEVSIKNLDDKLTQSHFSNKMRSKLTSPAINQNDMDKYVTNFFYDKLNQLYKFEIDINGLTKKLILEKIQFNFNLLNCSLMDDFFSFNFDNSENNCPKFERISLDNKYYIYISNINTSLRIKEVRSIDENTLKDIWVNFLSISDPYDREYSLEYDRYLDLTKIINYHPKINLYKDKIILLKINHFYSNDEINFLLGLL
ncbi:MAG: hypothetical protein O3C61_02515 [Proteobacteria bacterium]|nr:hypothetical protein [Pseudomonadota bacterium]